MVQEAPQTLHINGADFLRGAVNSGDAINDRVSRLKAQGRIGVRSGKVERRSGQAVGFSPPLRQACQQIFTQETLATQNVLHGNQITAQALQLVQSSQSNPALKVKEMRWPDALAVWNEVAKTLRMAKMTVDWKAAMPGDFAG